MDGLKRRSECSVTRARWMILAILLLGPQGLLAQSKMKATNTASANLRIQVVVVPMSFSPGRPQSKTSSASPISYDIPVSQTAQDVSVKDLAMDRITTEASQQEMPSGSTLLTTTIVIR